MMGKRAETGGRVFVSEKRGPTGTVPGGEKAPENSDPLTQPWAQAPCFLTQVLSARKVR